MDIRLLEFFAFLGFLAFKVISVIRFLRFIRVFRLATNHARPLRLQLGVIQCQQRIYKQSSIQRIVAFLI